jgi:hypothetical protein
MRIPGRWIAVSSHAAVVAGLLVLLLVATAVHDGPDANIGAGAAGLALLALGLPWTLGVITDAPALHDAGGAVRALVMLGPAVLNVGIGVLLACWRGRVARRRPGRTTT